MGMGIMMGWPKLTHGYTHGGYTHWTLSIYHTFYYTFYYTFSYTFLLYFLLYFLLHIPYTFTTLFGTLVYKEIDVIKQYMHHYYDDRGYL